MKLLAIFVFMFVALPICGQVPTPTKVHVNGVDLTYVEQGHGEPLILLHGGQGDYRSWAEQIAVLAANFRVISYSRRHNFPNENPLSQGGHTVFDDADDLSALIKKLKLRRVHIVGTSVGAFVGLIAALRHPDQVRSLILAEPPAHQNIRNTPEGEAVYQDFIMTVWAPAAAAFRRDDDQKGMAILVDAFGGASTFQHLPPAALTVAMQNSQYFKSATRASEPFPPLNVNKLKNLRIPVLIITGETTLKIHKLVNEELARLIPNVKTALIPEAGHGSPRENPAAFNEAMVSFLHDLTLSLPGQKLRPLRGQIISLLFFINSCSLIV